VAGRTNYNSYISRLLGGEVKFIMQQKVRQQYSPGVVMASVLEVLSWQLKIAYKSAMPKEK
jgi:hypothetical protein